MRLIVWTATVLFLLPTLATAEIPVPTMTAREIMLSEREVEPSRGSTILKDLVGRFRVEYRQDELGRRRGKVKIRIRLYEFPRGSDGVRHRLDIKPQIGEEPGLTFIYRF